jgi:hypothetical protein
MKLTKAVLDRLPKKMQRRVRELIDDIRLRRRTAPHRGLPHHGLSAAQIYPEGNRFYDSLREAISPQLEGLVIGRETPVASIGSCFADEFASCMRDEGFNYVAAESEVFPASANWGRVYTIPALRQIVMYSTTEDFAMPVERSDAGWFDPLREPAAGHHATREEAEAAIRAHRVASRNAFAAARVLIITLGQNEAWVERESGLVWARKPEMTGERFEPRLFPFEDDVNWLQDSLRRLRELNPDLDILLTVSPVAAHATFCGHDAITQSFAGKCVLRAVAERITRTVPRVWYFPSFEMVLAYNPHTLRADNRHVKRSTVDRIFDLLRRTVIR